MSIAVVDKAFTVIEALARAGRPLALAGLAGESRLPKPTVHRIVQCLRALGYVEQNGRGGAYELSPRLGSLVEYGRDQLLRDKAQPLMRRLHGLFDETVNLGVLEGITVRYAHVIETAKPLRWIVKPGVRDPFHTTALGRAIVADLPETQQDRLVSRACAALPARGRREARSRLERELAATRTRGWAMEEEETTTGVACVAVSLSSIGESLAAVSVSVPAHRFPQAQRAAVIAALLETRGAAAVHA